jgi:catechol 2,3-dioxygenase-like lactoylglutathione lyase family enzyme
MTAPAIFSFHHVALRSADVARLERFYVGVLGLRVVRRDAVRGHVWLGVGGGVLMLEVAGAGEPSVAAGTRELIAFAVADCDPWRSRLDGAAIAIEEETVHTLYFRDPDGRRVAVSSYPLPVASP